MSNLFNDSPYMKRIVSMSQGVNAGLTFVSCKYCSIYFQPKKPNRDICPGCLRSVRTYGRPHKCEKCKEINLFGYKIHCLRCVLGFQKLGLKLCTCCRAVMSPSLIDQEQCIRCQSRVL